MWRALLGVWALVACATPPDEVVVSARGRTCLTSSSDEVCQDGGTMVFATETGGDVRSSYSYSPQPGSSYASSTVIRGAEPGDILALDGTNQAVPADCRAVAVEPTRAADGRTEWTSPALVGQIAARAFVRFDNHDAGSSHVTYELDGRTERSVAGYWDRVVIYDCVTTTYDGLRAGLSPAFPRGE